MKKFLFALGLFFAIGLTYPATAQNISININVDKQPSWGPTGYDCANFYYFPDINIYFDVNNALFYFLSGKAWISDQYLPNKYSKYDLYNIYKVVVNEQQPWLQNKNHKKEYAVYKGNKTQESIRYSNESKYSNSKNNKKNWVNNNNLSSKSKGNSNNNNSSSNSKSKSSSSNSSANKTGSDSKSKSGNNRKQSGDNSQTNGGGTKTNSR